MVKFTKLNNWKEFYKGVEKMARCKWCGAEFEPRDGQEYCSYTCRHASDLKKAALRKKVAAVAKKYGFFLKNKEKINRAKMMLFHGGDLLKCPCDAQNPERYCGSKLCIEDVQRDGHCHCQLFWRKDETNLTDK